MTSRISWIRGVTIGCLAVTSWGALAQTPDAPVVRATASQSETVEDPARILRRRISVHLVDVTLEQALDSVAHTGRVRMVYSQTDIPIGMRVSLVADSIAVGEALRVLTRETGIEVAVATTGQILIRRPAAPSHAGGTIAGTVIDSLTGASLADVTVQIDEIGRGATTGAQGRYSFGDVAPGAYHVTARRVGFLARTRAITVEDGKVATLNFTLNQPPTRLDDVVTTAVGDQRRYEVGNTIATVDVAAVAATSPVTSLTDVITARAPGVQVLETSGLTGSGESIRVRGQSSLVLSGDPIIVVDGVRQDNAAGGTVSVFGGAAPSPTRLNDLDISDIATIAVLKGPSASTEYGTDAANGVIVVTTKHGTSGAPRWHASAEHGTSDIPVGFPNYYYSWGHTTGGSPFSVGCPLTPNTFLFGFFAQSNGSCVVDSVTKFNPLNHDRTSLFGAGDRSRYDVSVSGGSDAIRYYVAGGLTNDLGVLRMPPAFAGQAATFDLPQSTKRPNTEQQRSIRATTNATLTSTADVTVNGAYLSTYATTPNLRTLLSGSAQSFPVIDDSAHAYGYGSAASSPLYSLGTGQIQQTDRLTGGLTANWRPLGWLTAHATVGIDHGSQRLDAFLLAQSEQASDGPADNGSDMLTTSTTDIYTADLRAAATAQVAPGMRSVSSFGFQLVDTRLSGQAALSSGLSTADPTLNGSTNPLVTIIGTRQATLGGYGEEELSIADQLYLIGALRVDAASGFGRDYHVAAYPKASASWLALRSGPQPASLRFRAAFGESGVQPNNGAALQLYAAQREFLDGSLTRVSELSTPGNPILQPERSVELEGGADLGLWNDRLGLQFTMYDKRTHDALVDQTLGWDLGGFTYEENIGEVRNTGVEASLNASIVRTRALQWDAVVNFSLNHNKLIHLANNIGPVYT